MKKILLFALMIVSHHLMYAQAGEWTWMKGQNISNASAIWGTQGVATSTNTPLGFYEPIAWTDDDGIFWLYGGVNSSPYGGQSYGDLWKFDPITNNWTWMKGPGL